MLTTSGNDSCQQRRGVVAALLRSALSRALIVALGVGATSPAYANFSCSGRIKNLVVSPGGLLSASLIKTDGNPVFDYAVVCSVQTSHNGIEAAGCRSIQALLTTAVATNRQVTFWFADGAGADCSPARFPSWQTLSTSNNWYFGPRLDD